MSDPAPRRPVPLRTPSWWLDGRRITLSRGLVRELLVDGKPSGLWVQPSAGLYPGELLGRPVEVRVGPAKGVRFMELWSQGQQIPGGVRPVARIPASAGSRCSVHELEPAEIACARCGRFCCAACTSGDGQRCPACLAHELPRSALVVDTQPEEGGRTAWPLATIAFVGGLATATARWPIFAALVALVGVVAALVSGALATRLAIRASTATRDAARIRRANAIFTFVPLAMLLSGALLFVLGVASH